LPINSGIDKFSGEIFAKNEVVLNLKVKTHVAKMAIGKLLGLVWMILIVVWVGLLKLQNQAQSKRLN
jgi:uncharacterized membrane protein YccF (DUF307 family)